MMELLDFFNRILGIDLERNGEISVVPDQNNNS